MKKKRPGVANLKKADFGFVLFVSWLETSVSRFVRLPSIFASDRLFIGFGRKTPRTQIGLGEKKNQLDWKDRRLWISWQRQGRSSCLVCGTFLTPSELIEPVSPQAPLLGLHYSVLGFHVTNGDEPIWYTWFGTLNLWRKWKKEV